jgi:hypothetical protein
VENFSQTGTRFTGMMWFEWFLSEAIWHIMFPFWGAVRMLIAQEWYLDIACWIGTMFPGMNW